MHFISSLIVGLLLITVAHAQVDTDALPKVADGFAVNFFVKEPHIINPSALCFDRQGRLYVGAGPQYRTPKEDSPTDYIKILIDADDDGVAETVKTFAEGLNSVQSMAWRGNELWVANSPELTVLRDTDGDDIADEYQVIYTGLNNLRHGLHGLNWGPDGWLYMTIGNTWVKKHAPKPFRDLQGLKSDDKTEYPLTKVYTKDTYPKSYHPMNKSEKEGGIFRCRPGGHDLELFARGMRNPWDMCMDSGFNWLATDNDPGPPGERIFMPIRHGHYSMRHPWKFDWKGNHPAVAPVADLFPTVSGSGTGVVFYDSDHFPEEYRGDYLIADWTQSRIYRYQPKWDGAHQVPAAEKTQLVSSSGGYGDLKWKGGEGRALFRPTDIEVGPDGALYMAGWGSVYGTKYVPKDKWTPKENAKYQGRVFRLRHSNPLVSRTSWDQPKRRQAMSEWSFDQLLADLGAQLPVWRVDAQEELVRRGPKVRAQLLASLRSGKLSDMQSTWATWAVARIDKAAKNKHSEISRIASAGSDLNQRIQATRILGENKVAGATPLLITLLSDTEPRIRHAAIESLGNIGWPEGTTPAILDAFAKETDRVCTYLAWQTMRRQLSSDARRALLNDERHMIRQMVALSLMEDGDRDLQKQANAYLGKSSPKGGRQQAVEAQGISLGPIVLATREPRFRDHAIVTIEAQVAEFQPLPATDLATEPLLKVDIGRQDQAKLQAGWEEWNFSPKGGAKNQRQTFAGIDVTLSTTTNAVGRNYGINKVRDAKQSPVPDVWTDQMFFNNNPKGTMTLRFDKLKAGTYHLTTYSFANSLAGNDEGHAPVFVNDVKTPMQATFVVGDGRIAGNTIEAADLDRHATLAFVFTVAKDNQPIEIRFGPLSQGDTFGLNGFSLGKLKQPLASSMALHYTLDGKAPSANSAKTDSTIRVTKSATVKAAAFIGKQRVSEIGELTVEQITDAEWRDRLFATQVSDAAEVLVDGVQRGVQAYTDTPTETVTEVPAEIAGGLFVRLPKAGGPVSFDLNLPATVRVAAEHAPDGYAATDYQVRTSSGTKLRVFSRDAQPGKVALALKGPYQVYLTKASTGATTAAAVKPLLTKADLVRGEQIFFGRGTCFACHKVRDRGIEIGPGLVGINQRRDANYVIDAIIDPDAYIVEGYQQTSLKLKDGRQLFGMIQEETALGIKLALPTGQQLEVTTEEVVSRDDAENSGMPASFAHTMSPQDVADVTAWIMQLSSKGRPGPRSTATPGSSSKTALAVSHDTDSQKVTVTLDGELFTAYHYANKGKPILYPVIGPHGIAMTRHFPMKKGVPGEAKDHPHHQSIHYNHPVSGHDFWHGKGGAHIRNDEITTARVDGDTALIVSSNSWIGKNNKRILSDVTEIRAGTTNGGARYIDYQVTLKATDGDVRFEDSKEGTMSIRTHPALRLQGAVAKGSAINSEGVTGKAVWGKQAKWVDYWGPVEGHQVGIAIFDHPANPRYPTTWHARDYGLIAINPFGKKYFKAGEGAMTIKNGDSATFAYRFLFRKGTHAEADIPTHFAAWAKTSVADEPQFKPLFNGKDLSNFKSKGAAEFWRVEDGVLIGENNPAKKEHYLWTEEDYGDFVLEFDARWQGTTKRGVDTGIELRSRKLQLQLGISGSLRVDMTGSFYVSGKGYPEASQATKAKELLNPEGQWNTFRIQAKGNTFTCWINGTKASEHTQPNHLKSGPLALQVHGGVVMKCEFRNMRIAE